jgi:hypothetical protein
VSLGNGDPVGEARVATGARPATAVLAVPVTSMASAVRRRYRHWWWLPGWLFAALTMLPALLAVAWLVPGFAMLLAGRLTPVPLVIIFVPLAAALCYFTMRQIPVSWPQFPLSGEEATRPRVPSGKRPDVTASTLIATVVIAAAFAVWQVMKNSPQVFVSGDAGVYLQYGYWIAVHGTARIPQTAAAFGQGTGAGLNFGSLGFFPNGSVLTPAFMPGMPLVVAVGTWLSGISGATLMGPVVGGCAVLSFAGLAGRLTGPRWAPVAALVLALTLPEQYVSRTTMSEPLVQVLLFGGLCLIIDSLVVIRRRHAFGAMPGAGVASGAARTLACIGGFALGLTVLANIGSLSIVLPAFPVLSLMFVARRPQAWPLTFGLFLGVACGLIAGLRLAQPYLSSLSSQMHLFGLCAAGFGVATALVAPLGSPRTRSRLRRLVTARPRVPGTVWPPLPSLVMVAQWLVFCVPILLLAGFAIRPYIQALQVRGQTDPAAIRYVASLQRLSQVPVNGRRQYYEMSLDWVLWYLGAPAILLAGFGAALLGKRCVRAVATWRDSLAAARLWGLPLLIIGWSAVTVLWDPFVLPDQPAASRRLVPVVLPGLILLALWACSRLKLRAAELGARRVTVLAVGVCCVLALAIPAFVTSFDPSVTVNHRVALRDRVTLPGRVALRGTAASVTGAGEISAASRLCSAIGPNASVVFVDSATANTFEPVVRGMCGEPAAAVSGSLAIGQLVTSIERAGRRPVLLSSSQSLLPDSSGVAPQMVVNLSTRQDAQVLTGPPSETWQVTYTVWMESPLGSPLSP